MAPKIDATSFSALTPTTVTLNGQVNPELAPTTYSFQYGPTTSYGTQTLLSESIGEDGSDHAVSADVSALKSGTTYHFRVLASNINGITAGPDQTFNTPDFPVVTETSVSNVTRTTATLNAQVKPSFSPTTYVFRYGHTRAYGFTAGGLVGSDNTPRALSNSIAGLAPETTYHFRVLATNGIGTTAGPDIKFITAPEPILPPHEEEVEHRCKKGFVKRHGKCVKPRHGRHHKHSAGTSHGRKK